MPDDREREDLENLRKHPGWLRLKSEITKEWLDQLANQVVKAADDRDDMMALQKLRQVIAAKTAVERLLRWPEERLRILGGMAERGQDTAPPLSRRGGL